ncbi:MAG: ABC transporter permease [Fimbriimonadaceae bacterium]|nr:ABC transporter permease [Fimbriimonadaceae bacterium]
MVLLDNPLWTRELRGRMRGGRAVWGLLGFVLVLAGSVVWAYHSAREMFPDGLTDQIGQRVFTALAAVQGTLVLVLAPPLGAAAFSLEHEQQTLDGLLVSPLRAVAIVRGKILAACGFGCLLLTAAAPLQAVCVMLGGTSLAEIAAVYASHLGSLVVLTALAVYVSSNVRSTAGAVIGSYLAAGGYLLLQTSGPPFDAMGPLVEPDRLLQPLTSLYDLPAVVLGGAIMLLALAWLLDLSSHRLAGWRNAAGSWRLRVWPWLAAGLHAVALRPGAPWGDTIFWCGIDLWVLGCVIATAPADSPATRWYQVGRPQAGSAATWLVASCGALAAIGVALSWAWGTPRHAAGGTALLSWAGLIVGWALVMASGCRLLLRLSGHRGVAATVALSWAGFVVLAIQMTVQDTGRLAPWLVGICPLAVFRGNWAALRAACVGVLGGATLVGLGWVASYRRRPAVSPPPRAGAVVGPLPGSSRG